MPKSNPTLSPSTTNAHSSPTKSNTDDAVNKLTDVALRKKKNADAQAAFRARRANYIATLEETGNVLFFHRFIMLDITLQSPALNQSCCSYRIPAKIHGEKLGLSATRTRIYATSTENVKSFGERSGRLRKQVQRNYHRCHHYSTHVHSQSPYPFQGMDTSTFNTTATIISATGRATIQQPCATARIPVLGNITHVIRRRYRMVQRTKLQTEHPNHLIHACQNIMATTTPCQIRAMAHGRL